MSCITTFADISANIICLIEELNPSSESDQKFQVALDEYSLEGWADENPQACFRRFTIENNFDAISLGLISGDFVDEEQTFLLRICYPNHMGLYGSGNRRDRDRLIEEDLVDIDNIIGIAGSHNWVSGTLRSEKADSTLEPLESIRIINMTYSIAYRRRGTNNQ